MTTDRPVSLADALAAKDAAVHADHGPLRQWWAANTAQAPSTSGGPDSAPAPAPAAPFSARTSSGGLTSALYLFLVGLLVLVVGAAVLFPATPPEGPT